MDNQEFQNTVLSELKGINNRLDGVDKRLDGMDNRLDGMDKRLDGMDKRLEKLEGDNAILKSQTSENTQMLKSLIHASEVHKADVDRLEIGLAKVQGEVTGLRKDFLSMERLTAKNYSDIVDLKALRA